MNIEQERRDFEAAYAAAWPYSSGTPGKFDRDGQDDYADGTVHVGWHMYKAGRAALQSQDREGVAYESGRRCGLGFAHSVVSEIQRKHYYGSGIDGLEKLVQQGGGCYCGRDGRSDGSDGGCRPRPPR